MPLIPIPDVAGVGLVTDTSGARSQAASWSKATNVRFTTSGIERMKGNLQVYDETPEAIPLTIYPVRVGETKQTWVYAGLNKAYAIEDGTSHNITRQSAGVDVNYNADGGKKWSGGSYNGIIVLNNGVDDPQSWIPTDFSTRMTDLPNWPSGYKCQCLRPFFQHLIALDLTKSSVRFPTSFLWSHPADPGTVPISWNIADPTKDAGEYAFNQTSGPLIDLVCLGKAGVIYKSDSMHWIRKVGGTLVFNFEPISNSIGIPTKNAAIEFMPGQHFAWVGDDIIRHDGTNIVSIMEGKNRGLIKNIDPANLDSIFTAVNYGDSEVWFCFSDDPTNLTRVLKALVWNWVTGRASIKEIAGYTHIQTGYVETQAGNTTAWEDEVGSWDDDTEVWVPVAAGAANRKMLGARNSGFYQLEEGDESLGRKYYSELERQDIGIPFKTGAAPDISSKKFLTSIWFNFSGDVGQVFEIAVGGQEYVGGPITWEPTQLFEIGQDTPVWCNFTARLFAVNIKANTGDNWILLGMDFDVAFAGNF